jgi:hypothetical protein
MGQASSYHIEYAYDINAYSSGEIPIINGKIQEIL